MPRTTGVFLKRRTKRVAKTRRRKATRKARKLTNAKIKDITSRKKRDTMISYAPTTATVLPVRGQSYNQRPGFTDSPHFNLWCASYRGLKEADFDSTRTAQRVFLKGLSETYRVEIQNGPWQFRRIVFATKDRYVGGDTFSATFNTDNISGLNTANNRIIGQGAAAGQPKIALLAAPTTQIDIQDIVFKGLRGVDWTNVFLAPVDRTRVKLISDQKFRISSGNDSGAAKVKKFYTPINKMMTYDDEEVGLGQVGSGWSSDSQGIGNIYVMDVFWNEVGGDQTDDTMTWNTNATLFWHEH